VSDLVARGAEEGTGAAAFGFKAAGFDFAFPIRPAGRPGCRVCTWGF